MDGVYLYGCTVLGAKFSSISWCSMSVWGVHDAPRLGRWQLRLRDLKGGS